MRDRRAWGRALRLLTWIGVALAILLGSRTASAYPWMIRHQYSGCVPCHADPTGAGLLTEYGRAQGDLQLRMRYGVKPGDEASPSARFLWAVPTPDWLLLGGSLRNGMMATKAPGGKFNAFPLLMQNDLKAQITLSRFRAYGSLGYAYKNAGPIQITHHADSTGVQMHNLVSREHWLGVDLGEDKQFLLRAGRINLPFGLRNVEHTAFVRWATRTSFNDHQQHGVSFSYTGTAARAEVMAILGNYQVNPDAVRERGYSGFVEFSAAQWAGVGVSSMLTYAKSPFDPQYDRYSPLPASSTNVIRQAHGAFTRMAPVEPVVIMAEADALLWSATGQGTIPGFAGMVQVDYEPVTGLHLIGTGETLVVKGTPVSAAGWVSFDWFFAPHCDLRFDAIFASLAGTGLSITLLPQLHVYL
jgi:hypothetical protein